MTLLVVPFVNSFAILYSKLGADLIPCTLPLIVVVNDAGIGSMLIPGIVRCYSAVPTYLSRVNGLAPCMWNLG